MSLHFKQIVFVIIILLWLIVPAHPLPEEIFISQSARADPVNTTFYHSWDEMVVELNQIASDHPDITYLTSIGKSHEGRDIWAMKVSDNPLLEEDEPEIYYNAMHHAREWLTLEVCLYILNYLTDNYGTNSTITDIVDNRQIWVVPCVNPDGREYDSPGDDPTNHSNQPAGWRKNRRDNGDGSFGVDLNRNYGYMWGGAGASDVPSEVTYRGPAPFSENETRVIRDFVMQHDFVFAISYHTHSQLILYPWGYTYNASEDDVLLDTVAKKMAALITNKAGSAYPGYTPAQGADLYMTSGSDDDWLYGEMGIYSYIFELYPDSSDNDAAVTSPYDKFHPRADKVQPVCEDNIEAALYLARIADNPFQALNYHVSLSTEDESPTINQTEMGSFTITVANDGANNDTYDLSTSTIPGWPIALLPPTMSLDSETSDTASLYIMVPGGQPGGEYSVWVNATSQNDSGIKDSVLFKIHVPYFNDAGVQSIDTFLDGGIYPMGTYTINSTVRNFGGNSQSGFNVSLEIVELGTPVTKTVFWDDMENGTNGWDVVDLDGTASPDSWKQITSTSNSLTTSWWCGDVNKHSNKTVQLLVSPVFSLKKAVGANLSFYHKYKTESGYDFGSVDMYDGTSWTTLATYDGSGPSTFEQVTFDLVDFTGCDLVQLRFRFTSDRYVIDDGWYIDDVEVSAEFPEETTVFGPSLNQTSGTMAQDDTQQLGWQYTFPLAGEYRIYATTLLKSDEYEPNNRTYITIRIVTADFHIMLPVSVGWNLISTPFIPNNTSVPDVFLDMDGDTTWTIIQRHDAQDANNPWKGWTSLKPQNLNDLKLVDDKMGVWLYIPNPAALGDGFIKVNGTVPGSVSIDLATGWNLVGYPSLNSKSRTKALNNLGLGSDVDSIWTYDAQTQQWKEIGESDSIETGRGYWVHAMADVTWNVPL
ncbi:MAG: hypothetical protein JSW28_09385 [Thermoplasmata archaeon]|nr:MAG: hypothetical protein JSW28_09385 [Thermoplasmata archaeon]